MADSNLLRDGTAKGLHPHHTADPSNRRRPIGGAQRPPWFKVGDGLFLLVVGAESGVTMQWIHELEWNFLVLSLLGMGAAMCVQMLLSFGLAPLLGSIETMAPSMVVAMVVPMLVDVFEIMNLMIGRYEAGFLGAASGLFYFVYLEYYGAATRRRFALTWPNGARTR